MSTKDRRAHACVAAALMLTATVAAAGTSQTGQSGLIQMPDARTAPDGDLRIGGSHMSPYSAFWGNVGLLPWLEVSGRYTRTADVPVFTPEEGFTGDFGNHRDKAIDLKIRLFAETDTLPAIAVGIQDIHGTGIFPGQYIAASKAFALDGLGTFDFTLGYGRKRFDGGFGGVRWTTPWSERVRLVAEWDGYHYGNRNDFYFRSTQSVVRTGGLTLGVEYDGGWWGAQASHQDGTFGLNVSMMLPLQQPTFVPKTHEPPPVPVEPARPATLAGWVEQPETLQPLYESLAAEGFRDARMRVRGDHMELSASVTRMTKIGRAAGRIARVVALHAPEGLRTLEVTLLESGLPFVTYRFGDVPTLRAYFAGDAGPEQLNPTLGVSYVDASDWREFRAESLDGDDIGATGERTGRLEARMSPLSVLAPITIYRDATGSGVLRWQPFRVGILFNDPNGVLLYELYSTASYTQWLGDSGFYAAASGRLMLVENISDRAVGSNSQLPRVRSDMNRYREEGGRFTLQQLFIGHIANPTDRVYTSFGAGILEEMFVGVGGEVLYLPERGNWAAEFSLYGVRQRDFEGYFGLQDYDTITSLLSLHYRVPRYGMTFTARTGRFLAGDFGTRFEAKRRFRSGFELGAWYTITDANDIMPPATPDSPYRDKGIFVRFALGPFLPQDNASSITLATSPWTRDPGQMLYAPGNLYSLFERRLLLNMREYGPWTDFGY